MATTTITADIPDDLSTTVTLAHGDTLVSFLNFRDDRDWIHVRLEAGATYQFTMAASGGSSVSPYPALFNAAGTLVKWVDGSPSSRSEVITFTAPLGGAATLDYYFEAADYSGSTTGEYSLTLIKEPRFGFNDIPGDTTTGETLAPGGTLLSDIAADDDADWVRVSLVAGTTYTFAMTLDGVSNLHSHLRLRNDAGSVVANDVEGARGNASELTYTAKTTGTYYIDAATFRDPGAYRLTMVEGSPFGPDDIAGDRNTTATLKHGEQVTSDIAPISLDDDEDWFKVRLEKGKTYLFSMAATEGSGLNSYLGLFDRNGKLVAAVEGSHDDDPMGWIGPGLGDAELSFTATRSGTHYLAATTAINSTALEGHSDGGYVLSMTDTTPTPLDWVGTKRNDTKDGTAWDDKMDGRGGNDTLAGLAGNDHLIGGAGNDRLAGGQGRNVLEGGTGKDTAVYTGDATLFVDLVTNKYQKTGAGYDKLIGIENIQGGAGDDKLFGNRAPNVLWGGDGDDLLRGMDGMDRLSGGAGDDWLAGDSGNDLLEGGEGNDRMSGGVGNDTLEGQGGDDQLYGDAGDDNLYGGDGNDLFNPGSGKDFLDGGAGIDTVDYSGRNGDNTVDLASQYFQVINVKGSGKRAVKDIDKLVNIENVIGGSYDDVFNGNRAANRLEGGGGDDRLEGRSGDDTLIGGTGDDTMAGGTGADSFVFDTADFGHDTITDFEVGNLSEMLDVSAISSSAGDFTVSLAADAGGTTRITFTATGSSVDLQNAFFASEADVWAQVVLG